MVAYSSQFTIQNSAKELAFVNQKHVFKAYLYTIIQVVNQPK